MNGRFTRIACYFLIGVFVAGVPLVLELQWKAIAAFVLGRPISAYHLLPTWWKSSAAWLLWLPVAVGVLLIVLRLSRRGNALLAPFIIGALAPYLVLYGVLVFSRPMTSRISEGPFDQHVWAEHRPQDSLDNRRLRMVRDLMSHHLRVGMSTAELQSLLGSPDSESGNPVDRWNFLLGRYPQVSLDESDSILAIVIDGGGTVVDFTVERP